MKPTSKFFTIVSAVLTLLCTYFVALGDVVKAEAPRCYSGSSEGSATSVSCSDAASSPLFSLLGPPQQDTCYLLYEDRPSVGRWPFGSVECFALAAQNSASTQQEQAAQQQSLQQAIDEPKPIDCNDEQTCVRDNPLIKLINQGINILSAVVVVIIIAVIVMAGIQYSAAGGNPQGTAAAKGRIVNAIIALVAYLLLFMFFTWLIPGGLI